MSIYCISTDCKSALSGFAIQNADGTYGRPVEIGLAHELIHARNEMNGTADDTPIDIIQPDLYMNPTKNKQGEKVLDVMDEVNTRDTENEIRAEQGYVLRTKIYPFPTTRFIK